MEAEVWVCDVVPLSLASASSMTMTSAAAVGWTGFRERAAASSSKTSLSEKVDRDLRSGAMPPCLAVQKQSDSKKQRAIQACAGATVPEAVGGEAAERHECRSLAHVQLPCRRRGKKKCRRGGSPQRQRDTALLQRAHTLPTRGQQRFLHVGQHLSRSLRKADTRCFQKHQRKAGKAGERVQKVETAEWARGK